MILKFRAWDKKFNQWCYLMADSGKPLGTELNEFISESQKDCVLMQFTGLKDKNGTEIYEGDIVRNISVDGEIEKQGVVECGDTIDDWSWCGHGFLSECLGWYKYEAEVIGNIYENQ